MQGGFDIIVNGINRTFRDLREVAYEAAIYMKTRSPSDLVQVRDCVTQAVVSILPDGRIG